MDLQNRWRSSGYRMVLLWTPWTTPWPCHPLHSTSQVSLISLINQGSPVEYMASVNFSMAFILLWNKHMFNNGVHHEPQKSDKRAALEWHYVVPCPYKSHSNMYTYRGWARLLHPSATAPSMQLQDKGLCGIWSSVVLISSTCKRVALRNSLWGLQGIQCTSAAAEHLDLNFFNLFMEMKTLFFKALHFVSVLWCWARSW